MAAEALLAETLAIRRRELGEEHLHTALARKDLASLLLDREEIRSARALLTRALSTLYRVRPADDWNVAEAESLLGVVLAAEGRLAEAERCLRGAAETVERRRGPRAIQTRAARRRLDLLGTPASRLSVADR